MNYDVLWKGKFIEVISPEGYPYEAVIDKDLVFVLPIVDGKVGIRKELCPPYLVRDKTGESQYYTIISGGIEEGENVKEAAFRELKEEAGIVVKKARVTTLFPSLPICKVYASRASLLVIQVQEYDKEEASTDGTDYEAVSSTEWHTLEEIKALFAKGNVDMLLVMGYLVLEGAKR